MIGRLVTFCICEVHQHTYFVNPVFICKGERFAMYTEYVQKAAQLGMSEGKAQNNKLEAYNQVEA